MYAYVSRDVYVSLDLIKVIGQFKQIIKINSVWLEQEMHFRCTMACNPNRLYKEGICEKISGALGQLVNFQHTMYSKWNILYISMPCGHGK